MENVAIQKEKKICKFWKKQFKIVIFLWAQFVKIKTKIQEKNNLFLPLIRMKNFKTVCTYGLNRMVLRLEPCVHTVCTVCLYSLERMYIRFVKNWNMSFTVKSILFSQNFLKLYLYTHKIIFADFFNLDPDSIQKSNFHSYGSNRIFIGFEPYLRVIYHPPFH